MTRNRTGTGALSAIAVPSEANTGDRETGCAPARDRGRTMSDLLKLIAELENKAADCELMGSLAADPEQRFESRRRAEQFRKEAAALRDASQGTDRQFLIEKAEECRGLAEAETDRLLKAELLSLAAELEAKAA